LHVLLQQLQPHSSLTQRVIFYPSELEVSPLSGFQILGYKQAGVQSRTPLPEDSRPTWLVLAELSLFECHTFSQFDEFVSVGLPHFE
jgi:hypothetical protein